MDDSDIPQVVKEARGIVKFDHWVVYNLAADTAEIDEGADIGVGGLNSAGTVVYTGPCPPPQYEPAEHRYHFRLYALSKPLNFATTPTLDVVEAAARAVMFAQAELSGRYRRLE
jgi:hypothetical protein